MSENKVMGNGFNGTENNPNAGVLVYAMQHIGYENNVAVCDIIDNSIDAEASVVNITISGKDEKFEIIIADNGCGMSLETLDEALKFGSDSSHDLMSDLGKYGMGLSTAGLSLGNRTIVMSRSEEVGVVYKSATDVAVIQNENAFTKYLGEATPNEVAYFNQLIDSKTGSGTVVIIQDCFGVKNPDSKVFAKKLIKEVGRKYRKFMDSVAFFVNKSRVYAYDPLMLTGFDAEYTGEIYSDEDYEVSYVDEKTGKKNTALVHVKLAILPDCSQAKAKELEINQRSAGFSVLRNNREIAFGYLPNWKGITRHPSWNRVRGEISFDSTLDEPMGVNFTKNNIDMVDSVDNALQHSLLPQLSAMKNRSEKNKVKTEDDALIHNESTDYINKKSKTLIMPAAKKEKRNSPVNTENSKDKTPKTTEENRVRIPKKEQSVSANVKFETVKYGKAGPIYEAEQCGKMLVIRWNIDHAFYERFVREQTDNKTLVTSVDFLIYSLASAQVSAIGDDVDKAEMIESIISIMSTNMKILLS